MPDKDKVICEGNPGDTGQIKAIFKREDKRKEMSEHTPGPVETLVRRALQSSDYLERDDYRQTVDDVLGNPVYDAAPKLLAALKPCLRDYSISWNTSEGEICSCNPSDYDKGEKFQVYLTRAEMDAIKAAIAKAEGWSEGELVFRTDGEEQLAIDTDGPLWPWPGPTSPKQTLHVKSDEETPPR